MYFNNKKIYISIRIQLKQDEAKVIEEKKIRAAKFFDDEMKFHFSLCISKALFSALPFVV